jgi:WD40 repeat protein
VQNIVFQKIVSHQENAEGDCLYQLTSSCFTLTTAYVSTVGLFILIFSILYMLRAHCLILVCYVQGHIDELWGIAVCPSQNQFVSVGHDKLLYLWDTLTRSSIWCKELPVSN